MNETLKDAADEMKRLDHLIHVSLKYTRTVDVLISVLKRFIECIDFIMLALLQKMHEDKQIESVPESPVGKVNVLKENITDKKILEILDNYLIFRKLVRSVYTKRNEYRRYVTMTVEENGTIIEVDIDSVTEFYGKLREVFPVVSKLV